jgi:hypothetical protein
MEDKEEEKTAVITSEVNTAAVVTTADAPTASAVDTVTPSQHHGLVRGTSSFREEEDAQSSSRKKPRF